MMIECIGLIEVLNVSEFHMPEGITYVSLIMVSGQGYLHLQCSLKSLPKFDNELPILFVLSISMPILLL